MAHPRTSYHRRPRRSVHPPPGGGASTRGMHGASASRCVVVLQPRQDQNGSGAAPPGAAPLPPLFLARLCSSAEGLPKIRLVGAEQPVLSITKICVWSYSHVCCDSNAGTLGTKLMGKGKANQAPARVRHHVVVQGDVFQSLARYMDDNPAGLITEQPPGQSPTQPAPEPEALDPKTRLLIFKMIDMLDDLVNSGICLEELKEEKIAVLSDGRPKLMKATFVERNGLAGGLNRFKGLVSANYQGLGVIISRDILGALQVPAAVAHLLYLMKYEAWGMRLLINYHAAVVPLENESTLYVRLHNFIWEILRPKDPKGFYHIMENVEVDHLWRARVVDNQHLLEHYTKSSYENLEPLGTKAHKLNEFWQVSRLNRNGHSHPLEYALDLSAADGMAYTQCAGLGHIYRAHFPRFTYSIQTGLQVIDRLKLVEIRSLFSNSLKIYQEIR